jgi:hypothetical protein
MVGPNIKNIQLDKFVPAKVVNFKYSLTQVMYKGKPVIVEGGLTLTVGTF